MCVVVVVVSVKLVVYKVHSYVRNTHVTYVEHLQH